MKRINLSPILLIAVFCFSFVSSTVFAQSNSEIFIGTNGKLSTPENAIYVQKIKSKSAKATTVQTLKRNDSAWDKIYNERYKKLNDSTLLIRANSENSKGTIHRIFVQQPDQTYRFKDAVKGVVVRTGSAKSVMPLLPHGKVTEYYKNGNKKSVSEYNNNELVWNENWKENGDKYIDTIFYSVDSDPKFNPGINVMHQHILKGFKDAGVDIGNISGSLILGFVVMENGIIDGIRIIQGLGPNINSVAYQSFSSLQGSWTPAKLNDKPVRYFQVFPINFIYKQQSFEFAEFGKGGILHWGAY